ncbi:MAG: hypothetical protein R2911_38920 [Caldilineaceae bacterium]
MPLLVWRSAAAWAIIHLPSWVQAPPIDALFVVRFGVALRSRSLAAADWAVLAGLCVVGLAESAAVAGRGGGVAPFHFQHKG